MSDDQTAHEDGRRPGDEMLSDADVVRAVEVANNRLDEAEQVVWTTAGRAQSGETTDRLEALVHDMWEFQTRLADMKTDLRQAESDRGGDALGEFEWEGWE